MSQSIKNKGFFVVLAALLVALFVVTPAPAQEGTPPEEFAASSATAIDGQALLAGSYVINLWGIENVDIAGTNLALQARTVLDNVLNGGTVRCRVKQKQSENEILAQCVNEDNLDLGLFMLENGYTVVDRLAVAGSVFEDPYRQAEQQARHSKLGIWVLQEGPETFLETVLNGDQRILFWFGVFLLIPAFGFVVLLFVIITGFSRVNTLVEKGLAMTLQKEEQLRAREKFVIAAMLETELMSNRGKLEAFSVIYKDMIKTLRSAEKDHKYQQTGDIIHEAPALSRTAYDGNIGKLDLLGRKLAADLVDLYTKIHADPDYMVLESDMPVSDVLIKLDKTVIAAEKLMDPIDQIIGGLHVILRDEQAGINT